MTVTEVRATEATASKLYLQLGDERESAVKATLTTKISLAKALKVAQTWRHVIGEPVEGIDWARRELDLMTETRKGLMFLSPSGTSVYVLAPRTRTIQGVKKTMLSIVHNIPVGDVLSFEVAK